MVKIDQLEERVMSGRDKEFVSGRAWWDRQIKKHRKGRLKNRIREVLGGGTQVSAI